MKKIFSYYKPYKMIFLTDLFCGLLNSVIAVAIPMIIRYITVDVLAPDHFVRNEVIRIISILVIVVLFLFVLMFFCNYYMTYYGHVMGSRIEKDMRTELFLHFQKLPLSFYDEQKVGSLMSRMTTDLNNISEFMHHAPEEFMVFLCRLLGASIVLFLINRSLALITISLIVVMIIYTVYMTPKIARAFTKNHEKIAKINSQVEENLAGMKVVKSFANEDIEIEKFDQVNVDFLQSKKETFKVISRFFPVQNTFLIGLIPIVTIFAVAFILNNHLSMSDLVTFMLFTDILIGPLFNLLAQFEQFQDILAGYKRFLEILAIKPESDLPDALILKDIQGEISFNNVSFRHNRSKKNVFTKLNLKINPGEYVALVGSSGVGKTTLCNLLLRFYEVSNGEITIDGFNIKNLQAKSLRQNIGFVHQDTYLFADTISENIKYGSENASMEEIIQAAKNAYAHDFILNLPEGYQTNIGQRGLRLSGGQKQRLSIARAFLKNPSILILDEATSSLDNESEKVVQKSLERLAQGRTTIVIAHRLSTIRNAQRILVLAENKGIVEEGRHEELMAKKGVYYELYNLL